MNQQTLAEAMFKRKWFNPFPKFKFTERPDTASVCLLEGKVVLLVDKSPSAMILPTSILGIIEEANDYYFPTLTNVYLKVSRAIITLSLIHIYIPAIGMRNNLNGNHFLRDLVSYNLVHILLLLLFSFG